MNHVQVALVFAIAMLSGVALLMMMIMFILRTPRAVKKALKAPAATVGPEAVVDQGARVFDPANPPHYMTYQPRQYDPERAPRCTCHGRHLDQGERVLIWPIPDHPEGGMDVFCRETYGVSQ